MGANLVGADLPWSYTAGTGGCPMWGANTNLNYCEVNSSPIDELGDGA